MHFLSSGWLAGRVLRVGAGAGAHSCAHMGAGMCRRTERWKRPWQSSANSTDKIVPQIPKAGLGLSNLTPKTAPAYISRARAASLIPRNHVLCIRICHSDLHRSRLCVLRRAGERGFGALRHAGAAGALPAPGGRILPAVPRLSRARKQSGAGLPASPTWLPSTGKESLVYLIRFNQPYN